MNFVPNNSAELDAGRAICLHAERKIPGAVIAVVKPTNSFHQPQTMR